MERIAAVARLQLVDLPPAAFVGPENGVAQRAAIGVDGHKALTLVGNTNGGNLAGINLRHAGAQRLAGARPPGLCVLFVPPRLGLEQGVGGAALRHRMTMAIPRDCLTGGRAAVDTDDQTAHFDLG